MVRFCITWIFVLPRGRTVAYRQRSKPTTGRTVIRHTGLPRGTSTGREIRLIEEEDGWWSAVDGQMGVASQGPTRTEALENLDEAVALTEEARGDDSPAPEPDAPRVDG